MDKAVKVWDTNELQVRDVVSGSFKNSSTQPFGIAARHGTAPA
jgi:hypothetical protein